MPRQLHPLSSRGLTANRIARANIRPGKGLAAVAVSAPAVSKQDAANQAADNLTAEIVAEEKKYILQTYVRPDLVFVSGEGACLYDAHGKKYLDFAAGIAVNALGHGDKRWLDAVCEQASTLTHTSNLFHTVPQVKLAKRLVELSFADKVFFCNSGTEANEAAIKFARKWARIKAGIDPYDKDAEAPSELVSFTGSFHGRTLGSLVLTYKEQYKTPFLPLMGGGVEAKYQDLDSAKAAIVKGKTCAVFVEPLQGEGGINSSTQEFLSGLREACDEAGALLVFDEVQCGLGRTGQLWGHSAYGVTPDIMTLAKPLAGGLPIGATLVRQHVADAMAPGDHGSTFAGNPLVCHAANAVVDVISDPAFLSGVRSKGEKLRAGLREALQGNSHVKEIRGEGLICGIQLDTAAGPICTAARDLGLIVITAGAGDVIRLVPPLIVTEIEIVQAVDILKQAINDCLESPP